MTAHEATYEALIRAGYGDHARHQIPADWETRQGPDKVWGREATPRNRVGKPVSRRKAPVWRGLSWQERRVLQGRI